jgi:hypothetical protein
MQKHGSTNDGIPLHKFIEKKKLILGKKDNNMAQCKHIYEYCIHTQFA